MTPLLSIVIAHKNEPVELLRTLNSIRETAGDAVECVVVDDFSSSPLTLTGPGVKVLHNTEWLGVGASRHKGVLAASSDKILLVDAHSRFLPGWLHPTLSALDCSDKLLLCGQCLGLDENNMDPRKPVRVYNGARMIISDPEAEPRYRILNAKWRDDVRGRDGYPLSACMGACYAFHKKFFLDIGGLEILRGWGKDEELLSIKWLLCGGEIRICKNLKVGHKFRYEGQRIPFNVAKDWYFYNTMATALICCPADVCGDLLSSLGQSDAVRAAQYASVKDMQRINSAREFLAGKHRISWEQYIDKINQIDT